ncbi:MAG: hypothetical protein ABEJ07_04905 [Candidatus Nanohaloarchaea archaeon]
MSNYSFKGEYRQIRKRLIEEIPQVPAATNDLSGTQLSFIDHRLKEADVSREFRLQCMRDLDDTEMTVPDWLATTIDGRWEDYGSTEDEVNVARKLVKNWSLEYLEQGDEDSFMQGIGFRG